MGTVVGYMNRKKAGWLLFLGGIVLHTLNTRRRALTTGIVSLLHISKSAKKKNQGRQGESKDKEWVRRFDIICENFFDIVNQINVPPS